MTPSRQQKRGKQGTCVSDTCAFFIRGAIREALWELEEQQTRKAYVETPDSDESGYFDEDVWEQ